MARRYGKLPTEILSLDLEEYALNNVVLGTALKYEASARKGKPMVLSRGGDDGAGVRSALETVFARTVGRPKRGTITKRGK